MPAQGNRTPLRKRGATFAVLGADATGAMYGGLDIAEAVRLFTLADLTDVERSPHIEKRGIKFNIPLDSRTPSYSDAADSAQQNSFRKCVRWSSGASFSTKWRATATMFSLSGTSIRSLP